MEMKIKDAVAQLRENLQDWRKKRDAGGSLSCIEYSCAIPIAETLLWALDQVDLTRRPLRWSGDPHVIPDKPPGIKANDWVIKDGWTKPMQVMERRSDTTLTMWHCGHIVRNEDVRVYRRSDAPFEVGDRGLLGNIEVWVSMLGSHKDIRLVFRTKDLERFDGSSDYAWVDRSRFTLTEPVYPDGEKLSGKEKED